MLRGKKLPEPSRKCPVNFDGETIGILFWLLDFKGIGTTGATVAIDRESGVTWSFAKHSLDRGPWPGGP